MGNGSRGRRWRGFRLLPAVFKFISSARSSAQKKPKNKKRNLTFPDIFSLSRNTSLALLLFFSQFSVTSFDFYVIFHPCSLVFCLSFRASQIFLFFGSFLLVEGPNPDILSRIRFSVFPRTLFGVSSSSTLFFGYYTAFESDRIGHLPHRLTFHLKTEKP